MQPKRDKNGTTIRHRLSDVYKIDEEWLKKKGIFNPTLDVDSPLFVDPFLLAGSRHAEFSDCGFDRYEEHFSRIYDLLKLSDDPQKKPWKGAFEKFRLTESRPLAPCRASRSYPQTPQILH